jgi:hypothetical protein
MWQGVLRSLCDGCLMSIKDIADRPSYTSLRPGEENERFVTRGQVALRWNCSEKGVQRTEKRLGLQPYRLLRAIRYKLSDVVRIEAESLEKLPKRFIGLRPDQKAELLRRQQEEVATPTRAERRGALERRGNA